MIRAMQPRLFMFIENFYAFLQRIIERMKQERLNQAAASLTFTTVLALVPLATVALAIFTAFPIFQNFRTALQDYFLEALMPAAISEQVMGFINSFAGKARGLTLMGILFLIVSALAMMLTMEGALNQIWQTRRRSPLLKRLLNYWGALTLGPVLVGISLYLTGLAAASVASIRSLSPASSLLLWLVPVLLSMLGWALVYKTVPHAKVSWQHALTGAFVTAVLFEFIKRGFAIYLTRFANFGQLYGAFATVPIFLIWLYLCWMITLVGAVVTAIAPSWGEKRRKQLPLAGDSLANAFEILKILNYSRIKPPFSVEFEAFIETTDLSRSAVQTALETLQTLGWVNQIVDEESIKLRYTLLIEPSAVPLKALLDATVLNTDHPKLGFLSKYLAHLKNMSIAEVLNCSVVTSLLSRQEVPDPPLKQQNPPSTTGRK